MIHILEVEKALMADEYLNHTAGMMIQSIIDEVPEGIDGPDWERWHKDQRYLIREKWLDAGFPMILFQKDDKWCSVVARSGEETADELRAADDIQIFETVEDIIEEVNKHWGPNAIID